MFSARSGKIWHRNYYEMIVRSPEAEQSISCYLRMDPWKCVQNLGSGLRGMGNPALWNADKLGVLCSRNAPKNRAFRELPPISADSIRSWKMRFWANCLSISKTS